jgi:hypothetical protein
MEERLEPPPSPRKEEETPKESAPPEIEPPEGFFD